jgi:LPS sulfotransferase NodH
VEYVIAATPRTGSTMLCDLLRRNGLGAPREHLNPDAVASGFARALACRIPAEEFLDTARRRDTRNGWFGTKVMPHWLPAAMAACEPPRRSKSQVLRYLFPDAHYILLRRRSIVAAAVSTTLAEKTGNWQEPGPADVAVRPQDIHDNLVWLRECEAEWDGITADLGVRPLLVYYENLVSSPGDALAEILGHLGAARDEALDLAAATPTLHDARSAELTAAYLEWLEREEKES